jgi:hypothetical protein
MTAQGTGVHPGRPHTGACSEHCQTRPLHPAVRAYRPQSNLGCLGRPGAFWWQQQPGSCSPHSLTCQCHDHVGAALSLQLPHPCLGTVERVRAGDVKHDNSSRSTPAAHVHDARTMCVAHHGCSTGCACMQPWSACLRGGALHSSQTRQPSSLRCCSAPVVHGRQAVIPLLACSVPAGQWEPCEGGSGVPCGCELHCMSTIGPPVGQRLLKHVLAHQISNFTFISGMVLVRKAAPTVLACEPGWEDTCKPVGPQPAGVTCGTCKLLAFTPSASVQRSPAHLVVEELALDVSKHQRRFAAAHLAQ